MTIMVIYYTHNGNIIKGKYLARGHTMKAAPPQVGTKPKVKYLVVYQGKGTPFEKRIETGIPLYWVESLGKWCSVPED